MKKSQMYYVYSLKTFCNEKFELLIYTCIYFDFQFKYFINMYVAVLVSYIFYISIVGISVSVLLCPYRFVFIDHRV
jgi:hypothetical protein